MAALEMYAKQVKESIGLLHKARLESLRDYIKMTREEDLIRAIRRITDESLLKILWEAGLTRPLQRAVLARINELVKRRKEV